jgi:predicted N-acetyltransferase YhbS
MEKKQYEFASLSSFPELEAQANELIEEVFSYSKDHSFKVDFAALASTRHLGERFVLIDSAKFEVVAHIGTRIRDFIWQSQVIPVCMIGGVAVKKDLQGQGIFKFLMDKVLSDLDSQCALFLLWSDKHEMYEKWDFYLAGKQWCYRSNQTSAIKIDQQTYSSLSEEQKKSLKSFYKSHINKNFFSPLRSDDDWQDIEQIKSSHYIPLEDGYLFMNKGMDLNGIIHECVTSESINSLMNRIGDLGILWYPNNEPVDDHIMQDLQLVGLWKINKHPMALKKLSDMLGLKVDFQSDEFLVTNSTGSYPLKSFELLEEIFGYGNFGFRKTNIPIFISGLDSI